MPNTITILDKITRFSIYVLVFLLPLFLLPVGPTALDFQKQALLVLLALLGLSALVLKCLIQRKIELKNSILSSIILLLLLVMGLSTIFSWDPAQSFYGPVSLASSGFLTWLSLALLFFLITNSLDKVAEVRTVVLLGLGSGLLTTLFGFAHAWTDSLLPWAFTQAQGFNPIGSFNALALFAASLLPLAITLYLTENKTLFKIGLSILGVLSFLILIIANYWVTWVCLVVGMAALVVLLKVTPARIDHSWVILPIVLLVVALSFALINPDLPGLPNLPLEITQSYGSAFEMANKVITGTQGRLRAALGTGPGTFSSVYRLFRSEQISRTVFWRLNLQSPPSQLIGLLATTGLLGGLALLGVILSFGVIGLRNLIGQAPGKFGLPQGLKVGLFSSWLVLVAGKALYPAALSAEFLFWLFMALFMVIILSKNHD